MKTITSAKEPKFYYIALLLICFVLVTVSSSINYKQNDEYIHFKVVENFINGNFVLDQYLGSTFITQGFLGAGFTLLFGAGKLPVLTALFSSGCLLLFFSLLSRVTKNPLIAFLATLCLLSSPLYIYSSFGFMSEIYLLFFTIAAFYFFFVYETTNRTKFLVLFNLFAFASFFVKQFGIIILFASCLYFISRKRFKLGGIQFLYTVAVYLFYLYVFPRTAQMKITSFSLDNAKSFVPAFSVIFTVLMYLALFTAPLILNVLLKTVWTRKKTIIFFFTLALVFMASVKYFNPGKIINVSINNKSEIVVKYSSGVFPYLGNIFGREGYYPDNLDGTKYAYPGFIRLFYFLEIIGRLFACIFIALIPINSKRLFSFEMIFLMLGTALLLVTPKIYDRYLLILLPAIILFLIKTGSDQKLPDLNPISTTLPHKLNVLTYFGCLSFFIIFWLLLNYQYFSDFYWVNNYLLAKSELLVKENGVTNNLINSENSWMQTHPNEGRKWYYYFEYFKSSRVQSTKEFELLDKHEIVFPFSFYKDPFVYLYKRR